MQDLKNISKQFSQYLQGHFCPFCYAWHTSDLILCEACIQSLPWIEAACHQCAYPLETAAPLCGQCLYLYAQPIQTQALWRYQAPIERLIYQFKYHKQLHWGVFLASLLAMHIDLSHMPQAIIPMPASKHALMTRGFNPAFICAQAISKRFKIPLIQPFACIKKQAHASLNKQQRAQSAKQMFTQIAPIEYSNVLIVDDILTTGATSSALVKCLVKAGVVDIQLCVLARVLKR